MLTTHCRQPRFASVKPPITDWCSEHDRVHDVEDTAEARDDLRRILLLTVAPDQRLGQVAEHASGADSQTKERWSDFAAGNHRPQPDQAICKNDGGDDSAGRAPPGRFR